MHYYIALDNRRYASSQTMQTLTHSIFLI